MQPLWEYAGVYAKSFLSDVYLYMNVDPDKTPWSVKRVMQMLCASIFVGGIVTLIVGLRARKGTRVAVSARDYLNSQSVDITQKEDVFVNTITTSRRIEREDSSGGGGGGGSSTHTSSGGVTHGGGGRGF